jgi:hypothetical protein
VDVPVDVFHIGTTAALVNGVLTRFSALDDAIRQDSSLSVVCVMCDKAATTALSKPMVVSLETLGWWVRTW